MQAEVHKGQGRKVFRVRLADKVPPPQGRVSALRYISVNQSLRVVGLGKGGVHGCRLLPQELKMVGRTN